MTWKSAVLSAAALIALAAGPGAHAAGVTHVSECDSGDRIDGSSAAGATKKIEDAGFSQVHELKKGCDNFWHGVATKDGSESHVALTPQGQVKREGN